MDEEGMTAAQAEVALEDDIDTLLQNQLAVGQIGKISCSKMVVTRIMKSVLKVEQRRRNFIHLWLTLNKKELLNVRG